MTQRAEATADRASCRSIEVAVLAYVEERGVAPTTIADVAPYVSGDLAEYRIERRVVVGPGCVAGERG